MLLSSYAISQGNSVSRFATPDRNANYDITKYPERWKKFVEFTHNQIDELMTDYGRVDILFRWIL